MTCSAMQVSVDGLLCCTISNDHSVKIYDVVNYDMMVMIRTRFVPGAVDWVYKQGDVKARLAISDRNSSFVHIFDARAGTNEPIISREVCCSIGRGLFFPAKFYCLLEKYICRLNKLNLQFYFLYSIPQIHLGPVKVMRYNPVFDTVISADQQGIIEYWSPATLEFPEDGYVLFGMLIK